MKNVKKLLKKAMVFTVAASMLVGTPLTASAAGIRGVYSVSDGTNDDINHEGDTSHTGTVTNTDSNTNSGVINDNDATIIGIVLDKDYVKAEKGVKETLKATIVYDGDLVDKLKEDKESEEVLKELESKIKWKVTYADGTTVKNNVAANKVLSIEAKASDRTEVTLNPRQGTVLGEEMIVKAIIDGRYSVKGDGHGGVLKDADGKPVIEELKEDWNRTDGYFAEAKVFIKEYTDTLTFDEEMPEAYLKHTLDLNDYITRDPETANDEITWISTNTKVATVTAAGVVTFKKVNSTTDESGNLVVDDAKNACKIIAVGERKARAEWNVLVEAGTPASKVVIIDPTSTREDKLFTNGKKTKKADVDISEDGKWNKEAQVVMYAKVKAAVDADKNIITSESDLIGSKYDDGSWKKITSKTVEVKEGTPYIEVSKDNKSFTVKNTWEITDEITWTSNKPAIVSVEGNNREAEMLANGVGTATITAKASSGKSDKLAVTVKATLTDLDITNTENELYSGQTLQMTFDRTPEENKDGVKWSIAKVEVEKKNRQGEVTGTKLITNPNASINSKGVLTIKPKLTEIADVVDTVSLNKEEDQISNATSIVVVLESKTTKTDEKTNKKVPLARDTYEIHLTQSSIDGINVYEGAAGEDANPITTVGLVNNKVKVNNGISKQQNTTEIAVPKGKTYTATVVPSAGLNGDYAADASILSWKSSNTKVAEITPDKGGNVKITAKANGTSTVTVSGIRVVEKNDGSIKSASVIKTTFKVSVKQPVKTVTLNKPSVVLNQKDKTSKGVTTTQPQKVALKATLGPKGVGKAEKVHWSVVQTAGADHSGELANLKTLGLQDKNGNEITKASISVNLPAPKVGDVFVITARSDSGASATSTVTIVKKTTAVQILNKATGSEFEKANPKPNKPAIKNTVAMKAGESVQMISKINTKSTKDSGFAQDWTLAGTDNRENVEYTVDKKGASVVRVDKDGNIYALKAGKATITAKTPLGKKATLKVEVSND